MHSLPFFISSSLPDGLESVFNSKPDPDIPQQTTLARHFTLYLFYIMAASNTRLRYGNCIILHFMPEYTYPCHQTGSKPVFTNKWHTATHYFLNTPRLIYIYSTSLLLPIIKWCLAPALLLHSTPEIANSGILSLLSRNTEWMAQPAYYEKI